MSNSKRQKNPDELLRHLRFPKPPFQESKNSLSKFPEQKSGFQKREIGMLIFSGNCESSHIQLKAKY